MIWLTAGIWTRATRLTLLSRQSPTTQKLGVNLMSQEGWTHESFSPSFPPEFHGMFMFLYDIHEPANLEREGVGVGGGGWGGGVAPANSGYPLCCLSTFPGRFV